MIFRIHSMTIDAQKMRLFAASLGHMNVVLCDACVCARVCVIVNISALVPLSCERQFYLLSISMVSRRIQKSIHVDEAM